MKILLIDSAEFLTETNRNEGLFTLDQAKILKKNFDVDIFSPGVYSFRDILKKKNYKKFEIINGVKVYRKYKKNLIPYSFPKLNPMIASKISKISLELFDEYLSNNKKPDLLHAHKIRFSAFAAYAIYIKYKIPFIITEHNSDVMRNIFPNSLKKITKKIIFNARNFNTVSKLNSLELKKYFRLKNVDILYNVIPEIFVKNSKKNILEKKNYNFLSVTRFDLNKNIQVLVDTFIENFRGTNAILNIVGGGKLINHFKKYVLQKKMTHKIKIINFMDRKNLLKYYQKCDCFIMPSHKETFGLSMIEALLFKNYCITSKHSGYYELKNKKIVLPSFNSNSKQQLKKLMKKAYKKDIKFNYRKNLLKYFGEESFLKQINKIYSID